MTSRKFRAFPPSVAGTDRRYPLTGSLLCPEARRANAKTHRNDPGRRDEESL
jgi:hypothetical protein